MRKVFFFAAWLFSLSVSAQVPGIKFGQNRVQYKPFNFSYYPSEHFTTYFYQGGQDVGKYVVKASEDFYEDLSKKLDTKIKGKTDIIVYNTLEDLNQTNIGIYDPDQNQGGEGKLPNNKIFIYFNGSHEHLDEQLKAGIARIMGVRALSGKNRETRFYKNIPGWFNSGLNRYLSHTWNSLDEDQLRDGITSGRYRDLRKLNEWETTTVGYSIWHFVEEKFGKNAVINTIYLSRLNRNIDYGFQFALGITTQDVLVQWYDYYKKRFEEESKQTIPLREIDEIEIKNKPETQYYNAVVSPNGRYLAYVSNNWGRVKIHLYNIREEKSEVVFRYGWRTRTQWTDLQHPLLAFSPNSTKLTVVYNKKAVNRMLHYNLDDKIKEKQRIEKFQKVTSINYTPDGKALTMSAILKGQSDIFIYKLASTTSIQITDDFYDDFNPVMVNVGDYTGVMFASNRSDDTLRKERYDNQIFSKETDIFFYDIDNASLYQVTNTPKVSERLPMPFSTMKYQYISDESGISNIHTGELQTLFDHNQIIYTIQNKETSEIDSFSFPESFDFYGVYDTAFFNVLGTRKEKVYKTQGVNSQLTNFSRDIINMSFGDRGNHALITNTVGGNFTLYRFQLDTAYDIKLTDVFYTDRVINNLKQEQRQTAQHAEPPITLAPPKKVYTGQDFQSEFDFIEQNISPDSSLQILIDNSVPTAQTEDEDDVVGGYKFKQSKVRPYFVRFAVDRIIGQFNNDPIITTYQPFNPANPQYVYQPLNILFKIGITDILENHKVYGGFTFPTLGRSGFSFRDLGYFLTYENLKKRWDKKFTFYHQSVSDVANFTQPGTDQPLPANQRVNYSIKTNLLQLDLSYPFDVFHAVKFGLAYRNDRYVSKSENKYTHFLNDNVIHWAIAKAEYVFDNSFEVMENIRSGSRMKGSIEFHKDIPTRLYDVGNEKLRLPAFNNRLFSEIIIDARHYQKLYKQITLAVRATFNTSVGNVKMMHYIGGTENNLLASVPGLGAIMGQNSNNGGAPVDPNTTFVYQTIVAPVRGFLSNTRNGATAASANIELRVPIFSVLSRNRLRSEFLRTFQIVGFMDAGAAWTNWSVFRGEYPVFYEEYSNATTTLKIERVKAPGVIGTGLGTRFALLGYFVKFDAAWGFDSGTWSKRPVYYLGFGYDF
jgi:WD40 repeat protein